MHRQSLFALLIASACASSPPPAEAPPPAAPPPPVAEAAPPPAPAPTPEELKEAEEAKQLEADFAKLEADHDKALARWTPEMKAQAKALVDKSYANGKAAVEAALKGPQRSAENVSRDGFRHPVQTLDHFSLKPDQTVLEYGPGAGWYTEILAPVLAKKGKLYVTNGDPEGPKDRRSTYYAQRVAKFLESSPEVYGKVEQARIDGKAPKLALDGKLDSALVIRGLHGMVNNGTFETWLGEIHRSLKPKGILGIEQHRAKEGVDPIASARNGYLPQAWVIEKIEAAGFKLAAKSEVNANPKDTKDYPEGVWALPPTLTKGEVEKEKMMAIGESDRMTLRFVKVEKKK